MNFIKVFIYYLKKKYGYLSQEFNDSCLSKLQQRVQNKRRNEEVSTVWYEANKYIFPNYEAFEKSCKAYIKEKEAEEGINKIKKSVRRQSKAPRKNKR